MSEPYTIKAGTKVEVAFRHLQSVHPTQVPSVELAGVMNVATKNVKLLLQSAINAGLITYKSDKGRNTYVLGNGTPVAPNDGDFEKLRSLTEIARQAVAALKGTLLSGPAMAALCCCSAAEIDTALDPLVNAGKISRVDVVRGGLTMFDYRYSATWVPRDSDFDLLYGSTPPKPKVSHVAVAAPVTKVKNPASPWRKLNHLQLPGSPVLADRAQSTEKAKPTTDALSTGAELGKKVEVPVSTAFTSPEHLGWKVSTPAAVEPAVREAITGTWETAPNVLEANDLVCAMNSRGELVLDLGDDEMVKFPPAQALFLKRFLNNTSVLEQLHSEGSL